MSNASASKPTHGVRKGLQHVLQTLAKAQLSVIADALHCDESGACRVRSGERKVTLAEALHLLDALGFKAVDKDAICVRRDKYQAIATIAAAAMSDEQMSRRLIWEDE